MTRYQQVLPKSLSRTREQYRDLMSRYNYSLSRSILLGGADLPIKLMTLLRFDSSIGQVTFPGQERRADNISDYVLLIRNCHPRDILRCNRSIWEWILQICFQGRNELEIAQSLVETFTIYDIFNERYNFTFLR